VSSVTTAACPPLRMTGAKTPYRADIDGLRAIAVLMVVGYHAFRGSVPGGFVGVDVFFVISGFLISGVIFTGLRDGTFSFRGFYARRIRRIFPSLAVLVWVIYALGWMALLANEYEQLGKHIAAGAGFLSNFVLWNEAGYFDVASAFKPLLHLWSLSIEEQFYIVWPLLIYATSKRGLNPIVVMSVIGGVSFTYNVLESHRDPAAAFYSPFARCWELALGGLIAHVVLSGSSSRATGSATGRVTGVIGRQSLLSDLLGIGGLFLVLLGVAVIDDARRFPGWWALLPATGTALVLFSGPHTYVGRLLSLPVLVWFGLISFPLYLWHWPLLSFARIIEGAPSRGIRVTVVLLSVILAWLTYRLVEIPMRFGRSGAMKVTALCVTMSLAGAAGLSVFLQGGHPSRLQQFEEQQEQLVPASAQDAACQEFTRGLLSTQYCRFAGLGGRETVALIGDSHAHTLFPGLAQALVGSDVDLVLLANIACPPLRGTASGANEAVRASCAERTRHLLLFISRRSDIRDVVIATRGPLYISGQGFGPAEAMLRDRAVTSVDPALRAAAPAVTFKRGLQDTVALLREREKNVFYVLENPEIGLNPQNCSGRPFFLTRRMECEISVKTVLNRQAEYRAAVVDIPGLTIIDPLPLFCPDEVCRHVIDGKLMYADDDHLSINGSQFLAPAIATALRRSWL
jgi:peptidoglycan/LPS O-acetylase OafA/YrhL